MRGPRHPHVPYEPLARWIGRGEPASVRNVAALLHVSGNAVQYWINTGIAIDTAERVAVKRLGVPPEVIWPFFDEIEPCWVWTPWLRRLRADALEESWRLRMECREGAA